MTEYNSMYGTSLVSRAWHTCQICGISILCDYFSIYQHLTKAHHVSLQDYHNQLMVNYDAHSIVAQVGAFEHQLAHQGFRIEKPAVEVPFTQATQINMHFRSYEDEYPWRHFTMLG